MYSFMHLTGTHIIMQNSQTALNSTCDAIKILGWHDSKSLDLYIFSVQKLKCIRGKSVF